MANYCDVCNSELQGRTDKLYCSEHCRHIARIRRDGPRILDRHRKWEITHIESECTRKTELSRRQRERAKSLHLKTTPEWYWRNRERVSAKRREQRLSLRQEVLKAYGTICQCCGENEPKFLAIDHINGGGNKHIQGKNVKGQFYRWLRVNNYPSGFQVLCHNCNMAKSLYGLCPHQITPVKP